MAWREEMEKSLRAVLVTGDAAARQATVDLVNVLAAKGHPGFRDLLGSSAQVPARWEANGFLPLRRPVVS